MQKSRFSEEQMVKILREADKSPVVQVSKKHGISEQTIYVWRKRFGKLEAVDVKRLRQLEHVSQHGISLRRACAQLRVARSTVRYESVVAKRDAPVIDAMQQLAAQYPGFGVRRIQVFLARQGRAMSADRAYRIWKKAGLQVPRRRPRRRVATGRPRPLPATRANQVWAYDFVFDASANGQQLECLTVIDEFTRECLAIDGTGSIRSDRVIEVLSKRVSVRGAPQYLRSDNGPEFVSRAVLHWLQQAGIERAPIDPGKPWQNGSNESFNGKFRDECLGMQWFKNRIDAKVAIEDWRRLYNEVRPHSSLSNLTPAEYARRSSTKNQEPKPSRFLGIVGPKKPGRPLRAAGAAAAGELVAGAARFFHFRDRDDFEVDIVLEQGHAAVAGGEVKAAATVGEADLRGRRKQRDAVGKRFVAGGVLYDSSATVNFRDGLFAVPIGALWEALT